MHVGIIGGGIIGCAMARALSQRGAKTTIFEPRAIGGGATRASAGALVPYVEAHESSELLRLSLRSLALYDAFVQSVRDESGLAIDYARCGSVEVALNASEAARLRAAVARHGGPAMREVDGGQLGALMAGLSPDVTTAVVVEDHGYVSAPQLTEALAVASGRRGATVVTRSVAGIRPLESGVEIFFAGSPSMSFDHVVVASGAWAATLGVGGTATSIPVRPVKGQLVRVRPRAPLPKLLWSSAAYFVPQGNGDLLIGATMEDVGFDERTTADGVSRLLTAACRVLPCLADSQFLEARAGLRPATPDALPLVGPAKDSASVTYAVGHFRNGVILAPLTAELVAGLILDGLRDPALDVLTPARFGL